MAEIREYKTIYTGSVSHSIAHSMNELAKAGFRFVGTAPQTNYAIIIMERVIPDLSQPPYRDGIAGNLDPTKGPI